ncbi:sugar efflux transporter [Vibrio profundum]|uniref:sugar efflux transporter n=1 Tax=Vibrio profundum TaxID=2910247 RepID=UPI003D0EB245
MQKVGTKEILFIINSLTATAYAFILPIMSIYLINGIQANPDFIAYYSVSFAISGICFSQWFGRLSDSGVSDRLLFILSVTCIILSSLGFLFVTEPWQTLLIGIGFMGPGNACIPLILSMIKRFSEQSGSDITRVNSQMRSGVSIVWIFGPALAFTVADFWGYQTNFTIAATLGTLVVLLSVRFLPRFNLDVVGDEIANNRTTSDKIPRIALQFGAIILLGNLANSIYITAMPLYLTNDLNIPTYFPGLLLGVTAAFEVPVMLKAASLCDKYSKIKIMLFGYVCAIAYYALLHVTTSMAGLLFIQVFNGLFYGIFVGLGVTIIQEAFPKKGGFAAAYYSNMMRVGMMMGTSLVGFIAQYFSFQTALYASLLSIVSTIPLLVYSAKEKQPALNNLTAEH